MCSKSSAALRFSNRGDEAGGLIDANQRDGSNKGNERTLAGPRPCDPVPHHGRAPLVEAEEAEEAASRGEIVGWLSTIPPEILIPQVGSPSLVCAVPCIWTGPGILGLLSCLL